MSEKISFGKHWSGGISAAAAINPEENVLMIASDSESEYAYSYDGGENWYIGHIEKKINAICVLDPCHIWMACDGGHIYFLSGVAESPMVQEAGIATNQDLLSIDFADKERGYAAGRDGTFLFTRDGGDAWAYRGSVSRRVFTRVVAVPDTDTVLVLNDNGAVYQSFDYGQAWQEVIAGFEVLDMTILDGGIYFFDTKAHEIFYSQDGGMTWETKPSPLLISDQPPPSLSAMEFCSQE